jgi:outer membrane receptor for ferrienterochelin and colicins
MKRITLLFAFTTYLLTNTIAQKTDANIFGDVKSGGEHMPFVSIYLEGTAIGTTTDASGHYMLTNLPLGRQVIVARSLGYSSSRREVDIEANKTLEINFVLEQALMSVDEVVVTGTKTIKRSTETPVIVNVLDIKSIEAVQACNISEGLRFQPGLRIETDCQTCNYTQLRMNGLGGGYSQILINGRSIFSPLIGLYGMEQIPANMVERIEVVRGGGSALYGSSAIGGTVNVITRIPDKTDYSINFTTHQINREATDNTLNADVTMVSENRKAGVVLFANRRYREAYDHPGITLNSDGTRTTEKDNYSELPELRNNSFGGNIFYKPTPNQKLEMNFTSLYEYRYGGEMVDKAAHFAQQSEERTHNILMGGIDYQVNFNNDNSSFITYFSGQHTNREHYTGLYPVRDEHGSDSAFFIAEQIHLKDPPYGNTENSTFQGGTQLNHRFQNFLSGTNVFTLGLEYISDNIIDSIPQYKYGTNQQTGNFAAFLQSDWTISSSFSLLAGIRADKHNLLDHVILSPRLSLLYRLKDYTQFRLTWGTGFRAPQAFDTDLHIAFAGGGVSRITLSDDLKEERSHSYSGSVNFDFPQPTYILGLTVEAFYTRLNDAFYLQPVGNDDLGEQFEKRNGPGATVKGTTLELRANYNKKAQVEAGFTIQSSLHDEAVEIIEGIEPKREFLRTPGNYGYVLLTLNPTTGFSASVSTLYTGLMSLVKFSPDENLAPNEYRTAPSYTEINLKIGYTFQIKAIDSGIEIYSGIRNLTNYFQEDFDNYRNRDSNYMYGPSQPRTIFIGLKLKTFS